MTRSINGGFNINPIVLNIMALVSDFDYVNFIFIIRKLNVAAHLLAKLSYSMNKMTFYGVVTLYHFFSPQSMSIRTTFHAPHPPIIIRHLSGPHKLDNNTQFTMEIVF